MGFTRNKEQTAPLGLRRNESLAICRLERPPLMQRKNSTADDISAVIGFTATMAICTWFGDRNLYVPLLATDEHPVSLLIGFAAWKRMVGEFGGDTLAIPTTSKHEQTNVERTIAEMIGLGRGSNEIAEKTGLTYRRVQQIRLRIEASGLIPLILKPHAKLAAEKAPIKPALKTTGQKS